MCWGWGIYPGVTQDLDGPMGAREKELEARGWPERMVQGLAPKRGTDRIEPGVRPEALSLWTVQTAFSVDEGSVETIT